MVVYEFLNFQEKKNIIFVVRQWFMTPLRNMAELNARLDVVAFFANPAHSEVTTAIKAHLKEIHSVDVRFLSSLFVALVAKTPHQNLYSAVNGNILRPWILDMRPRNKSKLKLHAEVFGSGSVTLKIHWPQPEPIPHQFWQQFPFGQPTGR